MQLYKKIAGSLIAFHEEHFSDNYYHPAVYASLFITVAVSFLILAAIMHSMSAGLDASKLTSLPKLIWFAVGILIYLTQVLYLFRKERWKVALSHFRSLSRLQKNMLVAADIGILLGPLVWLIFELIRF